MKLEVVKKMKLLGVIVTSDLTWDDNTEFITKKAFSRLWLLRRLKKLGASREALCDIYAKNVRSVLEDKHSSNRACAKGRVCDNTRQTVHNIQISMLCSEHGHTQ